MKQMLLILTALSLSACQSWEWQEPIPQYAIESCLNAHGRPVYDGVGNESHFRCEFQRNLDARYFNDSRLLDPQFKTGVSQVEYIYVPAGTVVQQNTDSEYIYVPVDDKGNGVVIRPYEGFDHK